MAEIRLAGIIVDIGYVSIEDRSIIRITLKQQEKIYTLYDNAFFPYFYLVPSNDSLSADQLKEITIVDERDSISVHDVEKTVMSLKGKRTEVFRIETYHSRSVPKLRDKMMEFGTVYESDIVFWKRYLIDKRLSPLSGVHVLAHEDGERLIIDQITAGKIEQYTLKHICFDIETYNPRTVPRPEEDPVIMISYTNDDGEKRVLTTKEIKKDFVTYYKTEKSMIEGFVDAIKKTDVDVIAGYNSSNFDLPYLLKRAEKVKTPLDITRYGEEAKGEHHGLIEAVKIPGRTNADIYNVTRFVAIVGASEKLLKINRFTLGEVYKSIVGDEKRTVEKKNIWQLWDGSTAEREELAEYSLSDSLALEKLYQFFMPLEEEIAKISGTTLGEATISTTGQLVEYFLMRYAKDNNELIPNKPEEREIDMRLANPIEGAYVKTPEAGIYDNIVVLDFKGLYPSIIIAYNIDPSTLCRDCEDYHESPDGTRFVKVPIGIVPKALKLLVAERTDIKKAFKKDPDNKTLNARSQGLKILANSFYGYLGYARSRWYSRDCAASVTAFGRKYIQQTMETAEKTGFKVLYGDSVAADTQIRFRENGAISHAGIEELFRRVDHHEVNGKDYYFPKNMYVETLSKKGKALWGKVKYVVRHKTGKKVYRVWLTDYLHIDVTEDHSLIGLLNLSKSKVIDPVKRFINIKPEEIGIKASSIITKKRSVRGRIASRRLSKQFYEAMGFFIGDGSLDRSRSGKSYYLYFALGKEIDELIKKMLEPLKRQGALKNIRIKGRKGDVEVNGLATVRFFEDNIYDGRRKAIPEFMFNETDENISSFVRGLYSSDGTVIMRGSKPIIRYTTVDESLANQIRLLLWEIGISSSIFKERNPNRYNGKSSGTYSYHVNIKSKDVFIAKVGFLTDAKNKRISNYRETSFQKRYIASKDFDITWAIKVERLDYKGYVYDLEVEETHMFFANGVLAHNTDSIFLQLGKKTKEETLDLLKRINAELPQSMELELEDFYLRGVFVGKRGDESAGAKKKYALLSESGRIKIRGFELVRRDWSAVARETQKKVLEAILKEGSKEKAVGIVKEVVTNLKEGRVELKDLTIYTQLRKKIDSYDAKSPELAAARKAIERGARRKDQMEGTTIGYIITKHGNTISERAELEELATDYDADYYVSHQVLPATLKILKELGFSEEELKGGGSQKRL